MCSLIALRLLSLILEEVKAEKTAEQTRRRRKAQSVKKVRRMGDVSLVVKRVTAVPPSRQHGP
jgi:energy-coupling factor transporter transmembrane protein EcfT